MAPAPPMHDLARLSAVAEAAADLARAEILPRFRRVAVETKADGSPVTEADRAAEDAIRAHLAKETPDIPVVGEERGGKADEAATWIVDPIDGTISFSRGIPLFGTAIALAIDGEPVLGLIDLSALDERYVGWKGGGVRRNGATVRASTETELDRALICTGDAECFERESEGWLWNALWDGAGRVRGYSDVFGHAQVLSGACDAMVDLHLNPWDEAPARVLVPEAGGKVVRIAHPSGQVGLILGAPAVVDELARYVSAPLHGAGGGNDSEDGPET